MTEYIKTQTKDGRTVRIEVDSAAKTSAGFGGRPVASADVSTDAVADAYDQVLGMIRAVANGFVETLQSLDATPSAASVDFAIKIDADTGAIIAKSRENAHFKVSLSWKQAEEDDD